MTLGTLKKNWKKYAIKKSQKAKAVPLKDLFAVCWGETNGGLLFDAGGEQGAPACILKSDENDFCYEKTDWNLPDDKGWKRIGRFEKLPPGSIT